ncbi:hypothetical protein CIPAW_14G063500 [Carya illinoinensis]|uniref:Copper transporter n=1 Tax=Carya illinoinensis TaxID=32201 RepID=A0A8T1NHE2_CARIL|nr:hypothetical protein CIPAW_14G063500 [Carya illinoinensis]
MDGMDHGGHDEHGMDGMAPSSTNSTPMGMMDGHHEMAMMHMTFFWSKNAYILFSGWPGTSTVMSFNVGVFLAAVAGHSVGFLLFHSRVFKDSDTGKRGDVLPSSC